MRVAAGGALLLHSVTALWTGSPLSLVVLHVICAAMGMLLIVGLWTPIVGTVAAIAAAMRMSSSPAPGAPWANIEKSFPTRRVYEQPDNAESLERVKAHAPFGSGRGAGVDRGGVTPA